MEMDSIKIKKERIEVRVPGFHRGMNSRPVRKRKMSKMIKCALFS